jgi:hypothetical protein
MKSMGQTELGELARRLEAANVVGLDLREAVVKALRESFPDAAAAGLVADDIAASTDAIVTMVVVALPGWHFSIHGRARRDPGSWRCSLRRSDVLDDDEIVGLGEARHLNLAVLAAVVRVAAGR